MSVWRSFIQKLSGGTTGREWPVVEATIDVVAVIRQEGTGREPASYLATLTYFYRNPDLQSGDYCRVFEECEEATAQDWVASKKGRTVEVHVDPIDPTHSVLLDEDVSVLD